MTQLTGYELSRQMFDYSFENPSKITSNHIAIYFFAIDLCNRLGWKKEFGFPTNQAMESVGIKSYNTYKKCFDDLVDLGVFTVIQKSKNQYTAHIIALSKINKALDKALDKALMNHCIKQSRSTIQGTIQSTSIGTGISTSLGTVDINKPQTTNNKPQTTNNKYIVDFLNKEVGSSFRSSSKKTQSLISARLKEGFEKEDFELVIKSRCAKWKNDAKMKEYLRPETLFGTKFEGYLQDAKNEKETKQKVGGVRKWEWDTMSDEEKMMIFGQTETPPQKMPWT